VLQVVSLDGTYYQKKGVVSSGKVSLQEKAKRWMAEEISPTRCKNFSVYYPDVYL
jgi:hypothetical protein